MEMATALYELIPEFNEIQDAQLKEQVLRVWTKAMQAGGWQPQDLQEMPFTLLKDTGASMVQHVRGVVKLALQGYSVVKEIYGERITLNRDYLLAGALLHDVGKLVEYQREGGQFTKSRHGRYLRHPFSGVGLAYNEGLPEDVLHIIAVHSKEGDGGKRSPEAVILHHADFINFEIFA